VEEQRPGGTGEKRRRMSGGDGHALEIEKEEERNEEKVELRGDLRT
jgi:hypothetical protein